MRSNYLTGPGGRKFAFLQVPLAKKTALAKVSLGTRKWSGRFGGRKTGLDDKDMVPLDEEKRRRKEEKGRRANEGEVEVGHGSPQAERRCIMSASKCG